MDYTTLPLATPGASDIPADIVARFVTQNADIGRWLAQARCVMQSPGFP
jgi:hypothetical protein